jgi:serine/threonine protein kinase
MPDEEDAPTLGEYQFEVSLRSVGPGSKVFGHIRLERELGRGGMGVVWLAHDELIDLPIALKFLPDVVARDPEATDELKRELKRGLSLTHPGIVRVYRFEQDDTGAAIAMEYVDGPTMSSLKAKQVGGCFDAREIEGWIEQCCAALDYAHHEARIVHRDLKPRNLMLTSKGKLKIADFGVATSISDTVSRVSVNKSSGTPAYMSPQQALGGDPSPSDDIYSLGATIFELLTGRPPFYQGNILAQVQQRVPPRMSERRAIFKITDKEAIPEVWEATIAACLAKHPEDRPQSAMRVLECLRGQCAPAVAGQTTTQPGSAIDTPAAGDFDSTQTVAAVSSNEYATTKKIATPALSSPPPPAATPKKSSALSWLALAVFVGVGIAAWQWQQYADRRAAEQIQSLNAASSTEGQTRISPPTANKPGAKAMTAAETAEAERESALAAAHQIPVADQPWENSLQMKFVPVPGTHVLFSVYETRIDDYREFATEREKRSDAVWELPEFLQGPTHPVVNVSWDDAQAFCKWLTDKERAASRLGTRQRYRLPTDEEWSRAVGLAVEDGATPAARHLKLQGIYPWGTEWPPLEGAGNYMSAGDANPDNPNLREIDSYKDGFSHTAPTGSFNPNAFNLYDLGGNAWEWVEDFFDETQVERTLRGGSWMFTFPQDLLSASRHHAPSVTRLDYFGFRVVLDPGPQK